jgi:hypothetical protein
MQRHCQDLDAWNRLVTVTKAYRDSSGDLQSGSIVWEMRYDGTGEGLRFYGAGK